jgi:hypothetical protein
MKLNFKTIECNESRKTPRKVVFAIAFFGLIAFQSIDVFGQIQEPSARWKLWLEERMKEPASRQFPRFAWASFGYVEKQAKDVDFATYANAGFTEVQSRLKSDFLAAASQEGLNLILGTWEKSIENDEHFSELMSAVKSNPSVRFLLLKDETDLRTVSALGRLNLRVLEETPPTVLPMLTVLPGHASKIQDGSRFNPVTACNLKGSYCDYIKKIIIDAKPSAILSTLYPIYEDGSRRDDYYQQLAEMRDITRAAKIGMFGFILVTPHLDGWSGKNYRRPNRADIYWQAYSLLAYNAKGLAFYHYRTSPTSLGMKPLNYGQGIVSAQDSVPTDVYPIIQELNCELAAIGSTFLRLDAGKTFMPGNQAIQGISPGLPAALTEVRSNDVLLSEMISVHGEDRYILFVNTLSGTAAAEKRVKFKLQSDLVAMRISGDRNCNQQSSALETHNDWIDLTLAPGTGVLIRVVKN